MRKLLGEVQLGAERISRREARMLQRSMRRHAPEDTGKFKKEIRVRKSGQRRSRARGRRGRFLSKRFFWQVYIDRNRFSGFFYPILYLSAMYRKIRRRRKEVLNRYEADLTRIFKRVFLGRF